jgi:hypothetical protein
MYGGKLEANMKYVYVGEDGEEVLDAGGGGGGKKRRRGEGGRRRSAVNFVVAPPPTDDERRLDRRVELPVKNLIASGCVDLLSADWVRPTSWFLRPTTILPHLPTTTPRLSTPLPALHLHLLLLLVSPHTPLPYTRALDPS